MTIAFEPIVPHLVPKHPQVMVVPAAVSDSTFLSTMYVYNTNGVSSSLSQPNKKGWWNEKANLGEPRIVPVITMKNVLAAIPKDVIIDMIDTDMQGYDFKAISSADDELRV